MSVGIITSELFKNHNTDTHPENPKRLDAIFSKLKEQQLWKQLEKIAPLKITEDELHKIHTPEYVASVIDFCKQGGGRIDEDTVTCLESYDVAMYAAGSVLQAVDLVMTGQLDKVFCMIRPPGHHALPDKVMGFCLFNNLSLGAIYAMSKYKLDRILILDWDAHHGNGTEKIFYNSKNVFTVSWHQSNFWPFTGNYDDLGEGEGYGYNMNIPVPEGFTDEIFTETFEKLVVPAIKNYRPQLIMLAAGYDAHFKDTLAGLNATSPLYAYLSKRMMELASELCHGRLVATLEGGYTLDSLAEGVYNTLSLMQHPDLIVKEPLAKEKDENKREIAELINKIDSIHPLLKQ